MVTASYSYDRRPLYHGTSRDFEKPKKNGLGILWLAPNPRVAAQYSARRGNKGFVWEIRLKSSAKIVDLTDLKHPAIREMFESISDVRRSSFGPIDEKDWPRFADFGIFEGYTWTPKFLASKRIDGATCRDAITTMGIPHDSVALFNLRAIQDLARKSVEVDSSKTISYIENDVNEWEAGS